VKADIYKKRPMWLQKGLSFRSEFKKSIPVRHPIAAAFSFFVFFSVSLIIILILFFNVFLASFIFLL
jgi:hypothetical protein